MPKFPILACLTLFSLPINADTRVSEKEKWWRQVQEDAANAHGKWADGSEDSHSKDTHAEIVKQCGHDVRVVFDWKTFDMNQWLGFQKLNHQGDDMAAGYCAYQLTEIAYACRASEYKPYQKDAVKKIKTLTCHYKPCAQMPDPPHGDPGSNLRTTEAQYALSANGTNLDETYCENESNAEEALRNWLQKL